MQSKMSLVASYIHKITLVREMLKLVTGDNSRDQRFPSKRFKDLSAYKKISWKKCNGSLANTISQGSILSYFLLKDLIISLSLTKVVKDAYCMLTIASNRERATQ